MNNLNTPQIRIQNYDIGLKLGYHQQNIISLAGITATDYQGHDISQHLKVDDRQVNYDQPGQYRIIISVQDGMGNAAETAINAVVQNSESRMAGSYQPNPITKPHNSKKWLWVSLGIVLIAALWGFWRQNQQQNQALQEAQSSVSSMSSASSANSSANAESVSNLSEFNKQLQQEISDLKDALEEYKNDNNQAAFQQAINDLKQQNEDLKNQIAQSNQNAATKTLAATVDKMSSTLDNLAQAQSADQAQQTFDDADLSSKLDTITNIINGIKDKLGL